MPKKKSKRGIPDFSRVKQYETYSPKSAGDAQRVQKSLGAKAITFGILGAFAAGGAVFAGVNALQPKEEKTFVAPTNASVESSAPEESTPVDESGVRYDKDVSKKVHDVTIFGSYFTGGYKEEYYNDSLAISKSIESRYNQAFKFYPIIGKSNNGSWVLDTGDGNAFESDGESDNFYAMIDWSPTSLQKWSDEYNEKFLSMGFVVRSNVTKLLGTSVNTDDPSDIQRVVTPDLIIVVEDSDDHTKEVQGFIKYIQGKGKFSKDFKVTVVGVSLEDLSEGMDENGNFTVEYDTFFDTYNKVLSKKEYTVSTEGTLVAR